jgi:hypothetical protein
LRLFLGESGLSGLGIGASAYMKVRRRAAGRLMGHERSVLFSRIGLILGDSQGTTDGHEGRFFEFGL